MRKPKILIASILKPVNDTRMYEKFGISLSQTNKYEINIIGFYTKNLPNNKSLTFHPIHNFKRLNFKRLFAPLRSLLVFIKVKPDLIVINTHELLIVTFFYKILFGCKVIYDVRENNYRNILYTKSFVLPLRPIIAAYVRSKEYLSKLFINHYILAEQHYENEFTFSKGRSTIIQNKFKPQFEISPRKCDTTKEEITLLFSGTIAESTGVFDCIKLVKKLHEINYKVTLKIIGFCAIKSSYNRLLKVIENCGFIELIGGSSLVDHSVIIDAISKADFGLIYYPKNLSTINTIPTKLYEYLANELPIIIHHHQPWVDLCEPYSAAIPIDFFDYNPKKIIDQMSTSTFYSKSPKREVLWDSEEEKLLNLVETTIN